MDPISSRQCLHFGVCGGCAHQDLSYDEQLLEKQKALGTLFAPWWQEAIPVTPSPVRWHYRNKIDPSFAFKWYAEAPPKGFPRETVLGFKEKGKWRCPLELQECLIAPVGVEKLFPAIREWTAAQGLTAYHSRQNTGYLRHLLIRDGKRSGERMVMLITAPGKLPDEEGFVEAVQSSFPATSIYHGVFSGRGEVAFAEEAFLLHGKERIEERMAILSEEEWSPSALTVDTPEAFLQQEEKDRSFLHFQISPMSFFQTNPLAAERLYGAIRGWCQENPAPFLYDLYGGMGSIALHAADLYPRIISVEEVADASEDGRENTARNGVDHITFVTSTVQDIFKKKPLEGGLQAEADVIVDPPRSGLHPKALKGLVEWAPERLLYVSCNPARLEDEMKVLTEVYRLESLRAFDLFPHTPHVEVMAAFQRA